MAKKASSEGWIVWVWRAQWRDPIDGSSGPWQVFLLERDASVPPPKGGWQNSGTVTFKIQSEQWLCMFGGTLSDIPLKPTRMVLRGTARKVT